MKIFYILYCFLFGPEQRSLKSNCRYLQFMALFGLAGNFTNGF